MGKKQNDKKNLQDLRNEINAIDDKMISLLQQRMDIVSEVAKFKTDNHDTFFIRSAREADMIKSLVSKTKGCFPKATIVDIWRKIITASNMHEQKLSFAIHNPFTSPAFPVASPSAGLKTCGQDAITAARGGLAPPDAGFGVGQCRGGRGAGERQARRLRPARKKALAPRWRQGRRTSREGRARSPSW